MLKTIPGIDIKGNEILGDLSIDFFDKETKKPYKVVVFVGENGCGKTTLLNCITKIEGYHYVFLRQNSMYVGLSNESYSFTMGKELFAAQNKDDLTGGQNVFQLRINSVANDKIACSELLKSLGDDEIVNIVKNGELDNSRCGGETVRVINGRTDGLDMNTLSSGQQEILLKLKTLRQAQIATDVILIDEPEASLHPRWQKRIVGLIRELTADKDGNIPQIFIATHSEKVLESLINDKDVLIVRLFKEDKKIKFETISQMDLRLPSPTFAELDYVVFHIYSYEYHDELFNRFSYLIKKKGTKATDEKIQFLAKKLYGEGAKEFEKTRMYTLHNELYVTNTIPTYIRDYFHHSNEIQTPTEDELIKSIGLMRTLVKYVTDRGNKKVEKAK